MSGIFNHKKDQNKGGAKSQFKLLSCIVLILITCISFVTLYRQDAPTQPSTEKRGFDFISPMSLLASRFNSLGNKLFEFSTKGELPAEDFEKLDFSQDAFAENGKAAEYQVFNPKGKFKININLVTHDSYAQFDGGMLGYITSDPSSRILYNIFRWKRADGVIQDGLYAIVAPVKPRDCMDKYTGIQVLEPGANIGFAKDNTTVTEFPSKTIVNPPRVACLTEPNGRTHLFYMLIKRSKETEGAKWKIY